MNFLKILRTLFCRVPANGHFSHITFVEGIDLHYQERERYRVWVHMDENPICFVSSL